MKIDFGYQFKELDGKIIPEQPPEMVKNDKGEMEEKKYPPFTLRKACTNVLVMREVDAQGRPKEMTGKQKVERYELAKKIHNSTGLVDLQAEEIALLKELIGRIFPPITVGQAFEILDPHSEKK